jgi:hypothetical protein
MGSTMEQLRERFAQMEDEDLLRIVGEEASDYRPEAVELAKEEIRRRGLETASPKKTEAPVPLSSSEAEEPFELEEEDTEEEEAARSNWVTCAVCGGGLKSAILVADHRIIAVFEDNREARYVKMLVCPQCGNASLFVDMHTEVTE